MYFCGMENGAEKAKIKALIERKIAQVEDHINELEELTQPVAPDVAIGRVSRMDAINNKSPNEAALRQARDKLHGLVYALGQLDKISFGICTRCGQPIPPGRIMVRPESTTCMHCT